KQHAQLAMGRGLRCGRGAVFSDLQPDHAGEAVRPRRLVCAEVGPGAVHAHRGSEGITGGGPRGLSRHAIQPLTLDYQHAPIIFANVRGAASRESGGVTTLAAGWQYYFGTLPDGPEIVR